MANTYSQIYIQIVFATKARNNSIKPSWENELYKYITGIVQNKSQKMLAINGNNDHIHFLIGMRPTCCLSDLVREIKKSSNEYVNANLTSTKFEWQEGFGAFSYSHSALSSVIEYIAKQKEHHQKQSFRKEYMEMLRKFEVDFDEQYLFDWNDDTPNP